MTRSFFTCLILVFAALSWTETVAQQSEHTVTTIGEANEPSNLDTLVNIRDSDEVQDVEDVVVEDDNPRRRRSWWQPTDAPFQIVLSKIVLPNPANDTRAPPDIEPHFSSVFEVDLFDTPASTMRAMKRSGKKVICYFSAGTSEDWRPDYQDFTEADKGNCDQGWAGKGIPDTSFSTN